MKRVYLLISIVMTVACVAHATLSDETTKGRRPSPIFSISPTAIVFDSIRAGTTKTDSVIVTNNGTDPLVISNVTSSSNQFTAWPYTATIAASGSKVFYKVFVVLTTGNEKGSRAVSVVRV